MSKTVKLGGSWRDQEDPCRCVLCGARAKSSTFTLCVKCDERAEQQLREKILDYYMFDRDAAESTVIMVTFDDTLHEEQRMWCDRLIALWPGESEVVEPILAEDSYLLRLAAKGHATGKNPVAEYYFRAGKLVKHDTKAFDRAMASAFGDGIDW